MMKHKNYLKFDESIIKQKSYSKFMIEEQI